MDLPDSPRAKTVRISFPVERIQQLLHPGSTSGKGTG